MYQKCVMRFRNVSQTLQTNPRINSVLSKTSNVTHTNDINISSQENEDYHNQHDQQLVTSKHDCSQGHHNQSDSQFIYCKHNGSVNGSTMNWNSTTSQKKRKNIFTNGLTTMMCGIITSTHLQKEMKWGGSHTFNDDTNVFNLTKTKYNRKSKTRIVSEVSTSNKSNFYIGRCQS